ncbi:MAG: hypothetical protein ACI86H_002105 [bacterium]|jgi:hypothetical protein
MMGFFTFTKEILMAVHNKKGLEQINMELVEKWMNTSLYPKYDVYSPEYFEWTSLCYEIVFEYMPVHFKGIISTIILDENVTVSDIVKHTKYSRSLVTANTHKLMNLGYLEKKDRYTYKVTCVYFVKWFKIRYGKMNPVKVCIIPDDIKKKIIEAANQSHHTEFYIEPNDEKNEN